ncbi:formylglycine-generating enzyme family protein [Aeromicrobium sp. Leaf350]|uniref:formylglycine-generating enzyme family protein n=1 Tax=Aeromicrobium sp. Leaf350 TaxID=2876565 RepID=UPI001E482828|nr:formylglycine-generating enzyme family protein [Aeromicrobium sp. Leaf350]
MSSCCGPSADRESAAVPEPGRDAVRGARPRGLVDLSGGELLMGSDSPEAYPQDGESPVRAVQVAAFAIGATTVTVVDFAAFVDDTGHTTDAEHFGDSLVFEAMVAPDAEPRGAVAATPWWHVVPGATWRSPEGPGSHVDDRADHPVTHVSHRDATAYALWAGGRLPTELEWEWAARGGLVQQPFPWGAEREPGGEARMNTFVGDFPVPDGAVGTMPVTTFSPNAYGLHDTTGNVWEWTSSPFSSFDPRPVLRGGSYLCHDSYCRRYRTSARTANTPDTSLGHTGFRIAADA